MSDETERFDPDAPTVTPGVRSRTTTTFAAGEIVGGRYRIVRFIARGGMGEVYEAEDLELQGFVALKTILPEVAEDAVAVERFRREIQIARRITHPNVSRVFDVSHDHSTGTDVTFVTMELLAGPTLREKIVRESPLPTREALPIARQIAEGLAAAHRAGVVHRDLKSANVMLVPQEAGTDPRVVVTDFGLAHAAIFGGRTLTNTGDILGSPAYMSPEQIEGKPLTAASDIYSFGVLLYEMVTRGHPFEAETTLASVLKRLQDAPTSPRHYVPDLDPAWEHAILRCLEREPADRFADARDVVAAMESQSTGSLPSRRRARLRGLAIAIGGLAIVAAGVMFIPWKRVSIAPAPVQKVVPARRSVAVIGFRNQSGDGEVAWLSTALTEMLTTEIAAGEQVRTIPGESVARTKRDLGLREEAGFDARLRTALGTDYVVAGSYAALGSTDARQLRLDVQLHEALGGNVIASFAETGSEANLFELVSRAGARLREKLGVASVSPEAASGVLASLPSNPVAVRWYAQGLEAYREYDNVRARDLLEKAIAADKDFPLAHATLAGVYRALGYDSRAKEEAGIALRNASKLPREGRLLIEAQAHVENDRPAQAAEIYQALARFYPDNLDYATRTVFALINAGKTKEALAAVDAIRSTWDDPRVDLAEADAAENASDYQRSRAAALRALQKADARGQRLLAARAKLSEGYALLRTSQLPAARAAFEDSKRRYEAVGDRAGVGHALGGIGSVLLENEQLDEALAIFDAQVKIERETGSRMGEAADLYNMALVFHRKGDLPAARKALDRAFELQKPSGNDRAMASTLSLLANVVGDSGDLSEAMKLYEEALARNERVGAVHAAANNRNNLAGLYRTKGDLATAERLFQQALAAYRQMKDDVAAADALNNLAVVQRARGDIAAAEKSYLEAEAIYRKNDSKSDLALIAVNMSSIRMDRGDLAGAKKQAETALTIWRSTGEKSYAAYALMAVADAEARRGDLARAEAIVRDALAQRRQMGEESTAAESLMMMADLALEQGRNADAAKLANEALVVFEKEQRSDLTAVTKTILCRLAIERGDLASARTLLQSADALATSSGETSAQFAVAVAEARLAIASGKTQVAITQATALLDRATRQGIVPQQLDARLTLAEATLAAGRAAEARAQLETLEWDSNKRGFGWVAAKARRLRG